MIFILFYFFLRVQFYSSDPESLRKEERFHDCHRSWSVSPLHSHSCNHVDDLLGQKTSQEEGHPRAKKAGRGR